MSRGSCSLGDSSGSHRLTLSIPAHGNSNETSLSSAHDHLQFIFSKVVMETGKWLPRALLTHMAAGRLPHPFTSLFCQGRWAQRHSHDAGTAGLFNKTRSQNRVPVMPLWPGVVQQTGTNPTLRTYGLSALFTCSFHHKIVSHNSNSHTLLASYHTSCVQHTDCLSKKSFTPAAVRAQATRALRDG